MSKSNTSRRTVHSYFKFDPTTRSINWPSSERRRFKKAIQTIANRCDLMSNARTREEDCKTLRVLLLNFLDHEILLVSRAGGNYTAIRRYNRNDLSRRSVRRVLDALEKAGFIQQEIGRYDLKDGSGKRTKVARYQKLKTILGEFHFA